MECKRYRDTTDFNLRELLGELVQVSTDVPRLDIWVLVTSRKVPEQDATAIRTEASNRGVTALIVDTTGLLSRLAVLCANFPNVVLDHVDRYAPACDSSELSTTLQAIQRHPDFADGVRHLETALGAYLLGYDDLKKRSHEWLRAQVSDEARARASFGQPLAVRSQPDYPPVPRRGLHQALDTWWASWSPDAPFIAMVGEEGTGKTWAYVDWLVEKTADATFPATLVLTQNQIVTLGEPGPVLSGAMHRVASQIPPRQVAL